MDSTRTEVDYLESLANYLILQLVEKGCNPNLDPNQEFTLETIHNAIATIDNYLNTSKIDKSSPLAVKSTDI